METSNNWKDFPSAQQANQTPIQSIVVRLSKDFNMAHETCSELRFRITLIWCRSSSVVQNLFLHLSVVASCAQRETKFLKHISRTREWCSWNCSYARLLLIFVILFFSYSTRLFYSSTPSPPSLHRSWNLSFGAHTWRMVDLFLSGNNHCVPARQIVVVLRQKERDGERISWIVTSKQNQMINGFFYTHCRYGKCRPSGRHREFHRGDREENNGPNSSSSFDSSNLLGDSFQFD